MASRPAVAAGAIGLLLVASAVQAQTAKGSSSGDSPTTGARDLQGVWLQSGGGKFGVYPFTPPYQKIYDQRQADEVAGRPYQSAGSSCLPRGLVGMLTTGAYPIEIFQAADKVTIIKENGGVHRVFLNREHKPSDDLVPMFFGDAVGRWEGDWLAVDSISLGATDNLDGRAPHSDALHVMERFHRVSPDVLEADVTVDDPKALTRQISTHVTFARQPGYEMQEFYCTNERNLKDAEGKPIVQGAGR